MISFDQHWVGEHSPEWFSARGPLARAVVEEMRQAGILVFAGGLEEELHLAFHAHPDEVAPGIHSGPYQEREDFLGGMTIIEVAELREAKMWTQKVADACGWPQELRIFKP